MNIISLICFVLLAPLVGGLLAGIDRKITAHMQGRVGPSVLQPFYDVLKLFEKEAILVNRAQGYYVFCFLVFIVVTGGLFFYGGDMLLIIFTLTLASVFLVIAAYSSASPYSQIGAERELLQMMAYEPMVLLTAIGFYIMNRSFNVSDIASSSVPMIVYLPGFFIGFVYILTIKLRKSPFDLSMSHHAHQELVKGLTTEFSGRTLGLIEIAHWYENVFLLGFVYLFFSWLPVLGVAVCLIVYFFEILIDNSYARVKWQLALNTSWIVAITFGFANLLVLYIIR
jgi:ech hydrogenase subunit B